MAKLENYEKIERVLFQGGFFSIKNTVLIGQKSATGTRLNPVYQRTYNSTKYTDRNQLSTMSVRTSDFLVFAYTNFDQTSKENKGIEIYASYPHMLDVISFFEEVYSMVNTEGVYTKNGIAPQYADVMLESEELGGAKRLRVIPHLIEDRKDGSLRRGIMMCLNDEDKVVELDAKAISTILYILSKLDLMSLSNQTFMMGLMYDGSGASAGGSFTESNNSFESSGKTSMFSNKSRRTGFNGRTAPSATKPSNFGNNNASNDDVNPVDDSSDFGGGQQPEKEITQKRTITPSTGTGKKGISMADIQSTADEIDVSNVNEIDV